MVDSVNIQSANWVVFLNVEEMTQYFRRLQKTITNLTGNSTFYFDKFFMRPKHHPHDPGQDNVSCPPDRHDLPAGQARFLPPVLRHVLPDHDRFQPQRAPGLEPPCDNRQQPAPDLKPVSTSIKRAQGSCRRTSGASVSISPWTI